MGGRCLLTMVCCSWPGWKYCGDISLLRRFNTQKRYGQHQVQHCNACFCGNRWHNHALHIALGHMQWPAGQGRRFCPSTLLWWDPTWGPASSSGAPSTRKTWACWSGSRGGPQKWSKAWNTSPVSWGCLAWRTPGCRETLLQPFCT